MTTGKVNLIALAISIVLCLAGCSGTRVAEETRSPQEDYIATMDAWNSAEGDARAQLWFDFLDRHPSDGYTIGTIEYLAQDYYMGEKKDPQGAVAFAVEQIAKIADPEIKARAEPFLIQLYGDAKDSQGLRRHVESIENRRKLSLEEHQSIADAALRTEDWEMVRLQSETLMKKNTATAIRAEARGRMLSDAEVESAIGRNRSQALMSVGRAHLNTGDPNAAIASFEEASEFATYNRAGFPAWPLENLNLYWARALLQKEDPVGAMEKISVEAVIQEREDALEILTEAAVATGDVNDLKGYIERTRTEIARTMPDFAAYDYDGNKVHYRDLKGKVTLLSFWFPT